VQKCAPGAEFCADLVISMNTGTLAGKADPFGFTATLEGGLDCSTGTFQAHGLTGHWGLAVSSDPNDPKAPFTVDDPLGDFESKLEGMHTSAGGETIAGTWHLSTPGMEFTCVGPFTVSLQ
jgi:hypothetical protein